MRYEEFYNEYQETYNKRRRMLHRLPLYIIIGVILIGGFLALFFTSGNAYEYTLEGWSYGDKNEVLPKSFLATSEYEYLVDGEWTLESPHIPGEYEYRVKSKSLFGRVTYSKVETLTIFKRQAQVQCVVSNVVYGGTPIASGTLSPGDIMAQCDFIYDSMVLAETKVHVDPESIVIHDRYGNDVTEYYEFDTPKTLITFTSVPIVIQMVDKERDYDGTPLVSKEYEFVTQELVNGDTIDNIETSGSQLYVGECSNIITKMTIKSVAGENVENYRVQVLPGTLKVNPLEINVYTDEVADQMFDGATHTYCTLHSVEEIPDTLTTNDSVEATYAGTYDYVLTPIIINKDEEEVTKSYIIHTTYNKIHILPSPITITPEDLTKEYSGENKFECNPVITGDTFGAEIKISVETAQVYAGEGTTSITAYTVTLDGVDVSKSFDITTNTGKITIDKKPITISAKDDTKEYDNVAYSKSAFEITEGSLVGTDKLSATAVSSNLEICDDGVITIDSYNIKQGTEDVTSSYEITLVPAKLTITKRAITIKVKDSAVTYGETETLQTVCGSGSLLDGHSFTPVYKTYEKNIGKNTVELESCGIVDSSTNDVSSLYEVAPLESGTLTVNRRKLTIATISKDYTYSGEEYGFVIEDIYLKSGTLLTGQTITFVAAPEGKITKVGSVKSNLSKACVSLKDSLDNDLSDYYDLSYDNGTITVGKKTIYFETGSAIEEYELNKVLTLNEYTVTGLVAGHAVNPIRTEITGAISQVGSAKNTVSTIIIEDSSQKDVTDYYNIIVYEGTLTLVERSN